MVALSTTEAEYIVFTESINESMLLQGIVAKFGIRQKCVAVNCDIQRAIHSTKHQVFHERSKHIDVKLHFVRDVLAESSVEVKKILVEDNNVDALKKAIQLSSGISWA